MSTNADPAELMALIRNRVFVISGISQLTRFDHKPSDKEHARAVTIIRTCDALVDDFARLLGQPTKADVEAAKLKARDELETHS